MTHNLTKEVARVRDLKLFGLDGLTKYLPPDPPIALEVPKGLDIADISDEILRVYNQATGPARFAEQGSNNWVVDGSLTVTGKPILAVRPAPATCRCRRCARRCIWWVRDGTRSGPESRRCRESPWAITSTPSVPDSRSSESISGISPVEKLDPANPDRYWYRGAWKDVEIEHQTLRVKGAKEPLPITLAPHAARTGDVSRQGAASGLLRCALGGQLTWATAGCRRAGIARWRKRRIGMKVREGHRAAF